MPLFHSNPPKKFILPHRVNRLGDLAYNLWWTWNLDSQRLFLKIDPILWELINHNPVRFLRQVERSRLNAATNNRSYLEFYDRIMYAYDQYINKTDTWFSINYPHLVNKPIAYFSMEFGLHETLPIYAGGLGVLSGDHLAESSDLGIPLVAVGFFYTQGYFNQHILEDGWQEARYITQPFDDLPVMPVLNEDGTPNTISVELPGRDVQVRMWEVHVGRVPLYLLDSNVDGNTPADRDLTARLYSGDLELRISQEILLGVGGVRALRCLGYNPAVWHMNEGHSAFISMERAREAVEAGNDFKKSLEEICSTNVFTTHTPVAAGNDEFPLWIIDKYLTGMRQQLGITRDEFINLAHHTTAWGDQYSMSVLALKTSQGRNAVSELHGIVARKMWQFLWPDRQVEDVPIIHVTNGIHLSKWLARRLVHLYERYFGPDWYNHIDEMELWDQTLNIPDEQLWDVRKHLKRKLVAYMRERARKQWIGGDVHPVQILAAGALLDPYVLTIGFARRFAPYKRANLILNDVDRLMKIVCNTHMPVQIIFAGKSHPDHEQGKMLIQDVYRVVKKADNGGRLVFLEDYDMNLARYLIQGVDVWLNTPRRPNEASGTSGMKAAINGVLNFSVYDGWWREAYNGMNGWAIGGDYDIADPNLQDEADTASLYDLLEKEIVPLYYRDVNTEGMPIEWMVRMKESIRTLSPQFCNRRMLKEYMDRLYMPAIQSKQTAESIKTN
jgi:glycogen phosphorylase